MSLPKIVANLVLPTTRPEVGRGALLAKGADRSTSGAASRPVVPGAPRKARSSQTRRGAAVPLVDDSSRKAGRRRVAILDRRNSRYRLSASLPEAPTGDFEHRAGSKVSGTHAHIDAAKGGPADKAVFALVMEGFLGMRDMGGLPREGLADSFVKKEPAGPAAGLPSPKGNIHPLTVGYGRRAEAPAGADLLRHPATRPATAPGGRKVVNGQPGLAEKAAGAQVNPSPAQTSPGQAGRVQAAAGPQQSLDASAVRGAIEAEQEHPAAGARDGLVPVGVLSGMGNMPRGGPALAESSQSRSDFGLRGASQVTRNVGLHASDGEALVQARDVIRAAGRTVDDDRQPAVSQRQSVVAARAGRAAAFSAAPAANLAGAEESPGVHTILLDAAVQNSAGGVHSHPAQTGHAGEAARAAGLAGAADWAPGMSVVNQVAESIRGDFARPGQQIIIRLNPPELGKVRLTLEAEAGEIRGVLEVDNPRTFSELQREAPALLHRLADGGMEIRRLDVDLSDQGGDGPADGTDSLLRDGGQSGHDGQAGRPTASESDLPVADDSHPAASDEAPHVAHPIGEETINVWR